MAAGKGGGSWKVAYADFVTAMMAFFLVMWIGAQDQKTRQSVANYFVDPAGVSKKPVRTGAVSDAVTYGSVPSNEKASTARGRDSYDEPRPFSPLTKKVYDWLIEDKERHESFKKLAREHLQAAQRSPDVSQQGMDPKDVAVKQLQSSLRVKVSADLPNVPTGLYQDLMVELFDDVNWKQLAEDLLKS